LTIEERFDALFLFVLREKKRRRLSRPFLFPSGAFEPGEREREREARRVERRKRASELFPQRSRCLQKHEAFVLQREAK